MRTFLRRAIDWALATKKAWAAVVAYYVLRYLATDSLPPEIAAHLNSIVFTAVEGAIMWLAVWKPTNKAQEPR